MKPLSRTERIVIVFASVLCVVLLYDLACQCLKAAKAARADARIEQVMDTVNNVVTHIK